jgi:hypothetical protein
MDEDNEVGPVILGDQAFIKRIGGGTAMPRRPVNAAIATVSAPVVPEVEAEVEAEPEAIEAAPISITVNPRGEIISDTTGMPDHILAQLQTPEAQAQMAKQYKEHKYADQHEPPRPLRYLNEREDRRLFADRKPPGMSGREWRQHCRATFRKSRKTVLKIQRSMRHGREPDKSSTS